MDNQTLKPTLWEANPNLKTLLLVLIVVFLLSGIGLVVFAQWSSNYRQQVYEQTEAGLPKHEVKASSTDISTWKTYTNAQYGFEFKYSGQLIASESDGSNNIFGDKKVPSISYRDSNNADLWIEHYPLKGQQDIKSAIKYVYTNDVSNLNPEKIVLLSSETAYFYEGFPAETPYNVVFVIHNNSLFGIRYSLSEEIFRQVLSTFKFIDDTSTWKTYTNTQYGFEIQLPSNWQVDNQYENEVSFNSPENIANINDAKNRNQSEGPPANINFLYFDDIAKQAASEGIKLTSNTLDEYVKLSKNDFFKPQKISFAGQTAYRGTEAGLFDIDAIWFQKGSHLYKIWLMSSVGMDDQLSAKILSTFKFIN